MSKLSKVLLILQADLKFLNPSCWDVKISEEHFWGKGINFVNGAWLPLSEHGLMVLYLEMGPDLTRPELTFDTQ